MKATLFQETVHPIVIFSVGKSERKLNLSEYTLTLTRILIHNNPTRIHIHIIYIHIYIHIYIYFIT